MNTYRNGKIARLPQPLREQVNLRLTNNKPGPEILAWLHGQPDTQKILDQYFDGIAITQQNLSQWRHGGYREWVKLQEKRQFTRELIKHSDVLDSDFTPERITRAFATVSAADFVADAKDRRADCKNSKQRWDCSCEIQNQLARRRRDETRVAHLKLRQAQWNHQLDNEKKTAELADDTERRRQMLTYFKLQPNIVEETRQRGGTPDARDTAAFVLELQHGLKIGILGRTIRPTPTDEFQDFDTIATEIEIAQGVTSDPQPPEGRPSSMAQSATEEVPRVPNISTTPAATQVQTAPANNPRNPQYGPSPIALAKGEVPIRPTCTEPTPISPCYSTALKVEPTSTN